MATYAITKTTSGGQGSQIYTFTGLTPATTLADQTDLISTQGVDEIIVTAQVVKAGTTDSATMRIQGTNDGGTSYFDLPDIANSPNNGTETTPTTASTHTISNTYSFDGSSLYQTPKPLQIRVAFTGSGTTDNKSVINGTIITRRKY